MRRLNKEDQNRIPPPSQPSEIIAITSSQFIDPDTIVNADQQYLQDFFRLSKKSKLDKQKSKKSKKKDKKLSLEEQLLKDIDNNSDSDISDTDFDNLMDSIVSKDMDKHNEGGTHNFLGEGDDDDIDLDFDEEANSEEDHEKEDEKPKSSTEDQDELHNLDIIENDSNNSDNENDINAGTVDATVTSTKEDKKQLEWEKSRTMDNKDESNKRKRNKKSNFDKRQQKRNEKSNNKRKGSGRNPKVGMRPEKRKKRK